MCAYRSSSGSDTAQIIAQCRESLDIEYGPLLAAVLFDDTEPQTLFLTIHHLVVDLVSWRVLFQELEELLTLGTISHATLNKFPVLERPTGSICRRKLESRGFDSF